MATMALINKKAPPQVFSCEFCKICKNTLYTEHFPATVSVKVKVTCRVKHELYQASLFSPDGDLLGTIGKS